MNIIKKYSSVGTEKENATAKDHQAVDTDYMQNIITPSQKEIDDFVSDLFTTWKVANGQRHTLALSIIGYLKRMKWSPDSIYKALQDMVDITGVGQEHIAQIKYALNHTGNEYGYTTIKKIRDSLFPNT